MLFHKYWSSFEFSCKDPDLEFIIHFFPKSDCYYGEINFYYRDKESGSLLDGVLNIYNFIKEEFHYPW